MLRRDFRDIHWNIGLQLIGIYVKKKGAKWGVDHVKCLIIHKKIS